MNEPCLDYLRPGQLPSVWCPGCGNGVVVKALIQAVRNLELDRDRTVVVGGIGCSGRTPFLLDFNTMHTTHGRALAFATGIKLVRPDLHVIVVMGDGDASAIGGNHLIHACRRNIGLTAIVFNNAIYGQTGGQLAPTTPHRKRSTTTPWGNVEEAFDLAQLALGAGAGFVARTTTFDFPQMVDFIQRGIAHRGFALVEVMTTCPTYFGRLNDLREPYDMLHFVKDATQPDGEPAALRPATDRWPTGIFRSLERPEYSELYAQVCEEAARCSEPA